MNELIRKAVSGTLTLSFTYKGAHRVVEPHTHGLKSNGREGLCAWQTGGGSGEGFRLYDVNEMLGIALGEGFDGARPGYHRQDQRFSMIYAEL